MGGRAPTRGAPTGWVFWQRARRGFGEGAHARGVRTGGFFRARACRGGRVRTRGSPYGWIFWGAHARGGGECTHKGCPYGWIFRARALKEVLSLVHPQGVPLRVDSLGRAHLKGGGHPQGVAPTGGFLGRAHHGGEGTHKGCPYGILAASGGFVAGGCSCPGRSVGQSHLNSDAKIADEGRAHGGEGRAPTRGAPTGGFSRARTPRRFCRWCACKGCPYGVDL